MRTTPQKKHRRQGREKAGRSTASQGAALITALGMLLLFVGLGTAYVRYMTLEQVKTRGQLESLRALHLARGGIHAAIGEIEAAAKAGINPRDSYSFDTAIYLAKAEGLVPFPQQIDVTVTEENGRGTIEGALRSVGMETNVLRRMMKHAKAGAGASQPWNASRGYRVKAEVQIVLRTSRREGEAGGEGEAVGEGEAAVALDESGPWAVVEAVVALDESGAWAIRFWKEARREPADDAEPVSPEEPAIGEGEKTVEAESPEEKESGQPAAGENP